MRVVEIFKSIEGEGIRVGLPVTFIRLWGCNLRCSYCDTPYSHSIEEENTVEMSVLEILMRVQQLHCPNVTITGGEPLIHTGICDLIDALIGDNYRVNIETNGTMPVPKKYKDVNELLMFTFDYKCSCSGMNRAMDLQIFSTMRSCDVLKFVVASEDDLDLMTDVIGNIISRPQVFVSPVFGEITPAQIVDYILTRGLYNVRVQVQLHKIIWEPEERGV